MLSSDSQSPRIAVRTREIAFACKKEGPIVSKKNSDFGERLIRAAREARAIARGEADPSTYRIYIPPDVDAQKQLPPRPRSGKRKKRAR